MMDQCVQVAIARFPDRGHAIEELAGRDEDFLSLCIDLADAEAALVRWKGSDSPFREARCAEYRDLVRDLAAEVAAAPASSDVGQHGCRAAGEVRAGSPVRWDGELCRHAHVFADGPRSHLDGTAAQAADTKLERAGGLVSSDLILLKKSETAIYRAVNIQDVGSHPAI
jgi:hypothetical protein